MSLKAAAIQGVKWTALSSILIIGLQFVQISVVSKLLGPASFGLMGMVMVVIGFAQAFSDMGLSSAIIQRKDLTREQLSSLYWLNLISGFAVFMIVLSIRPIIISFYRSPELNELLIWASFIFLITPLGQQFQMLFQKELRFNLISKVTIAAAIAGTTVTIAAAYSGYGALSLVWGQLVNSSVASVSFACLGWRTWRPKAIFAFRHIKGFIGFGLYRTGEYTVTYFNNNLDNIIIGRLLGAEALGYYTIAYNLVIIPLAKINPIINRVAFPVFSQVQDDTERLKRGYFQTLRAIGLINFPIYLGMAVVSPTLVMVLFGEGWTSSILILQVLCGVGMLRCIANPAGSLVLAKGRAELSFKYNLAKTVIQIPCIWLGAWTAGLVGAAVSFLLLKIVYFFVNYLVVIRGMLGPCFRSFVSCFTAAFAMSTVMAGMTWLTGSYLPVHSNVLMLGVQVTVGAIIYLALNIMFRKQSVDLLRRPAVQAAQSNES
ncbi:MOP flippase family protein [Paenibacillus mesophilus]|uniref:MOP flippase family protein n=1 Tax=Paenibacillus mesophilus TaxID=2582849 RepID=UPI00110DC877|nr:MOP flippase family protein [Paenibacillus mesophilus]TMV47496.1 MOP flippase family protein [Paenibacillus mesophilus]